MNDVPMDIIFSLLTEKKKKMFCYNSVSDFHFYFGFLTFKPPVWTVHCLSAV